MFGRITNLVSIERWICPVCKKTLATDKPALAWCKTCGEVMIRLKEWIRKQVKKEDNT